MGLKRGGVHRAKHKEAAKASNLLTPVQVPLKTSPGALSRHNIFFSFNIGRHCVSTGITLKKKIRYAFCSYGTHSVWGNTHIIRQFRTLHVQYKDRYQAESKCWSRLFKGDI